MTVEYAAAFSRRGSPEFCKSAFARKQRGRRECRVLAAPAVSRANMRLRKLHTSIQVQSEQPGIPCAMGWRLIACSPRWTALLPPSPPRSVLSGTSRQHRGVRTTRLRRTLRCAYVSRLPRPPHLTARSWRSRAAPR